MDRGLRRVPDSNPPIPSLGSHNSLFPLQSFSLLILVERKEVRGKKNNLASLFRSQGGIRKVEKWCTTSLGQRTLSFKSFFISLLDTHSSGFHKSTGGLRTAFSGAVGGLAQHNQRRITERPGEAERAGV